MGTPKRWLLAVVVCVAASSTLPAADAPFKLESTWKLGGNASWDYMAIDSQARILYVARLDRVMLVDLRSGKLLTEITGLTHAHGIAFDDQGKVGYISDGGAGKILVFDRSTYKVTASVAAGKNPDSILFEPTKRRVFAFNGVSHNATVVDAETNSVVATIPLPGKPEFSVTDGAGNIFVNIEDSSAVLRMNADTLKTTASWPLAPGEGPSGLAIDTVHHRLFSVCDNNRMVIVDSENGKLVAAPRIGEGADAVAFDAARGLAFSSNGESGTISVVRADGPSGYATTQTIATKLGARTMAVDPETGTAYTVSAALGPKPPASASNPKRRPAIVPDSLVVLVYARSGERQLSTK